MINIGNLASDRTENGMQKEDFIHGLGIHLRKLREERNMTQTEIASIIGKDRQSYQRIELGITNPTVGYLYDISNALKVPFTDLFSFIKG